MRTGLSITDEDPVWRDSSKFGHELCVLVSESAAFSVPPDSRYSEEVDDHFKWVD